MANFKAIAAPSKQLCTAWFVHFLTGSAAVIGMYTLYAIYHHNYLVAFWLMGLTILIDAIDGSLARLFKIKEVLPSIDGALLDNIVDFLNYVITPCFLLLVDDHLIPGGWGNIVLAIVILSSAYQFTHTEAKTKDNFFKGFPCYWNFTVFYMVLFQFSATTNALVLLLLSSLIFIPIKYIYLSRMDYLTHDFRLKVIIMAISISFGIANIGLLLTYPNVPHWLINYVMVYIGLYSLASLYRTFIPFSPNK